MISNKFKLSGLTCQACAKVSKLRIGKIEGVKEVEVDLEGNTQVKSDREISKEEIQVSLDGTDYRVL